MISNGTLAFSRIALLATLVGWAGVALGQSSAQSTRADSGWEAQQSNVHEPAYRRADSSADQWKPTRRSAPPESKPAPQKAAPKTWIVPTQANGQTAAPSKPVARSKQTTQTKQAAVRAPKAFVPPTDAKQLAAPERPAGRVVGSTAALVERSLSNDSPTAAADDSQQTAASNANTKPRVAPRSQQERVAHRPRPTPTKGTRLFDDSWIHPLKQVAYQSGEPEELYAPRGQPEEMPLPSGGMMGPGGSMIGSEMQSDGEWIGSPGCDSCGDDGCGSDCGPMCADGVGCSSNCEPDTLDLCTVGPHDDESCDTVRIRVPKFKEVMAFGGVHGFKGPYDQERDSGNFGFQEGFNLGGKLPFTETGYQLGFQAQQSQLSGDADTGIGDSFVQHFFTTGVFRRTNDGFQGGAVWDLLLDERDTSVAFSQVRAEVGFVDCGCHEFGASLAVHLKENTFVNPQQQTTTAFQSVDQYLLYYRMHGARGGEGRLYGGITDDVDGIVGADFLLPLTESWSLQPAFTYLIPNASGAGTVAAREEAWNISINLVWHWRGHARSCHSSPYRPLFNVADNGYMIIDNRP
jgi:hypothetical protein